jgi:predicted nuclease of predicted toxin-antitoxin system
MKLLFDHNLSFKLAKRLSVRFPGSLSAKAAGLSTATDLQIWEYAKINDFILVTQDADFVDWNRLFGSPPKIIWVRFGNQTVDFGESKFLNNFDAIEALSESQEIEILEIR